MANVILKMATVAALGFLTATALPPSASAHARQRVEQRCDRDGDLCAVFRCDWDGDDCVRIGPWRRVYANYDRRQYGYNDYGYYGGSYGYQYGRGNGYYDDERREEWRERRRDRNDDDWRDDRRDRDGDGD